MREYNILKSLSRNVWYNRSLVNILRRYGFTEGNNEE